MTFEEFEKATPENLRDQARACFNQANSNPSWGGSPTLLAQAQFYMQEMDRREATKETKHSRWIEDRDFWLEIAVIGLIVLEIVLSVVGLWLAVKEGRDEDALMDKQNRVLANLQASSGATAKTLVTVETTMEAVDTAVHNQLARMSLPQIATTGIDMGKHVIGYANQGAYDLEVAGMRIGRDQPTFFTKPIDFRPGIYAFISLDRIWHLPPKDTVAPLEIYLRDDVNDEYIVNSDLSITRQNDAITNVSENIRHIRLKKWSTLVPTK